MKERTDIIIYNKDDMSLHISTDANKKGIKLKHSKLLPFKTRKMQFIVYVHFED